MAGRGAEVGAEIVQAMQLASGEVGRVASTGSR